jgi:hypothetical protein
VTAAARPGSRRVGLAVLLCVCFATVSLPAQTTGAAPVPYEPDEFPQWALDLRRAEIIAIGAFPITFVLSRLLYDLGRWTTKAISGSTDAASYAPWFFSPVDKPDYSATESRWLIVAGAATALGVSLADFFINRETRDPPESRARSAAGLPLSSPSPAASGESSQTE